MSYCKAILKISKLLKKRKTNKKTKTQNQICVTVLSCMLVYLVCLESFLPVACSCKLKSCIISDVWKVIKKYVNKKKKVFDYKI